MIEPELKQISVSRQCELLKFPVTTYYYKRKKSKDRFDNELKLLIDKQYIETPFYGTRRMTLSMKALGYKVNRKRVQRLMREMGLQAVYPKKNLSKPNPGHRIYPYLLRNMEISHPDQVWCTDITYIPMPRGHVYLTVVMDWNSRYILSWEVSVTMDTSFCLDALNSALSISKPEIFNTDQGSQFTSRKFTDILKSNDIWISMDGRGRVFDNIFVERFWRSLKYEEVYLKDYETVREAREGIGHWIDFYNKRRPHSSLGNLTPETVYFSRSSKVPEKESVA